MRRLRVQSTKSKTRGAHPAIKAIKPPEVPYHRFVGISLSGGKADKACMAVIEYYPGQKKIFLTKLIEKIKAEEFISADLKIHESILQFGNQIDWLAFDVPLSLPKCMTCTLKCPGYEACEVEEIAFIRHNYEKESKKRKPKKLFTPYTERSVESYLAISEPEMDIQHALGANLAPLTARAHFIHRRLKVPIIEVLPRLAVWKLGQQLKINRSQLKVYRNSVGGELARSIFLTAMVEQLKVFIYQQDAKSMSHNIHSFEAFVCAYVALLKYLGKTESPPKNFPLSERWIEFPSMN